MTTTILPSKDHCIYPGEYIPLPKTESLIEKLRTRRKRIPANSMLRLQEFEDSFKIEMPVAGVKREDIIIYINNNILSIVLIGKIFENVKKNLQVHQFDTDFIEQHLVVPANADIEFISANYKEGVLNIHIPKGLPNQHQITREVVIY